MVSYNILNSLIYCGNRAKTCSKLKLSTREPINNLRNDKPMLLSRKSMKGMCTATNELK